ncbi:MAG: signal peptidase II [Candidatus Riflebacteria bacterium]|nr:signal peptidase II [Candidatus Riflebacteria bacterium]
MAKLKDHLLWLLMTIGSGVALLVLYPVFLAKNLKFYLRAPSIFLYATLTFTLDRITKLLVMSSSGVLPCPVIKDLFTLTYVRNYGVAFGWFPDWRLPPILMALVMIVIIGYYSFQLPLREKLTRWSLALLVGGALGNLYDRVAYGFVVDFFSFHFGAFDFPVFNVADVAIDVGVVLLFIDIFLLNPEEPAEDDSGDSQPAPSAA